MSAAVAAAAKHMRLPPMPSVAELMRLYRVTARQRMSQSFLLDSAVTDAFVAAAGDLSHSTVVEVGAGPGTLTRSILRAGAPRVIAIELDRRMEPFLEMLQEASEGRLQVVWGDALHVDYAALLRNVGTVPTNFDIDPDATTSSAPPPASATAATATTAAATTTTTSSSCGDDHIRHNGPAVKVIGNLPFGVATPLLMSYLRQLNRREGLFEFGRTELTLAFQKELATRLAATPGDRRRSRVSCMAQYGCTVGLPYSIHRSSFTPRPKVDTGVVSLVPRPERPQLEFEVLEDVCRALFAGPRKMLRNNAKRLLDGADADEVDAFLSAAGVDGSVRPAALDNDDIQRLGAAYVAWRGGC